MFARVCSGNLGKGLRLVRDGGLYSSRGLENWVDGILKAHLGMQSVKFSDLPRPLVVLGSDITARTYKVWSRDSTPTTNVAFAVRSSCAIPVFFQPVQSEGALLVDGGLVSSLPTFLRKEIGHLFEEQPMLCLRLSAAADKLKELTPLDYVRMLIETAINGVTAMQLSVVKDCHVVEINTGAIRATRFDLSVEEKQFLIGNGIDAVREFVKHEQVLTGLRSQQDGAITDNKDDILGKTIRLISTAKCQIIIFAGDMSWIASAYLPLLAAHLRGVSITIIGVKAQGAAHNEAYKEALAVGCGVLQIKSPTIYGTCVDFGRLHSRMILLERTLMGDNHVLHGREYAMPQDENLMKLVSDHYEAIRDAHLSSIKTRKVEIRKISENEICEALRSGVAHYEGMKMYFDDVDIQSIQPLSKYLHELKLARLRDCRFVLEKNDNPVALQAKGSARILSPPVVEKLADGSLVLIDGTHRLFQNLRDGVKSARVVIVENGNVRLPANPLPNWGHVTVVKREQPFSQRYDSYNQHYHRDLRSAFKYYFTSR